MDPRLADSSFRLAGAANVAASAAAEASASVAAVSETEDRPGHQTGQGGEGHNSSGSSSSTPSGHRDHRFSEAPYGPEGWRFSHYQPSEGPLDPSLTAKWAAAIDAGAILGGLRAMVAEHLGIQDANGVFLNSRDGIRPGTLQGEHWEVRQLKGWLCGWLSIGVNSEKGYLIFNTLSRQYLVTPRVEDAGKWQPLDLALEYFRTRVPQRVQRDNMSALHHSNPRFCICLDGSCLNPKTTAMRWGATYDSEFDDDVADVFVAEESWLLAPTGLSDTCCEARKLTDMVLRVAAGCDHPPLTCRECLQELLDGSVEDGFWSKLSCPECSRELTWHEVKRWASRETFNRYDSLLLREAL